MDDFLARVVAQREAEQRAQGAPVIVSRRTAQQRAKPFGAGRGQGRRHIKVQCGSCGYVARTTKKWLELFGGPLCPNPECERAAMLPPTQPASALQPPPSPDSDSTE